MYTTQYEILLYIPLEQNAELNDSTIQENIKSEHAIQQIIT